MKIQALDALASETHAAYVQVRDLYHRVLLATGADSSLLRCQQFFSDNSFADEPIQPKPYDPVAPGARLSFDAENGFHCTLSMADAASSDRGAVNLKMENGDATPWFAIEFALPWRDIRSGSTCTSGLFLKDGKAGDYRFDIFYWTLDGKRHSLFGNPVARSVTDSENSIRFDGEYGLPSEKQVDFEKEPTAAFFIPPAIVEVNLIDVYVGFGQ